MEDKYLISQVGMTWETWHRKREIEWKEMEETKYRVSKAENFSCVWECFVTELWRLVKFLRFRELPKASDVTACGIIDVFLQYSVNFNSWFSNFKGFLPYEMESLKDEVSI